MIVTGLDIETTGLDYEKDEWIVAKFSGGLYEATKEGILVSHNPYKGAKRGPLKTHKHKKTGYHQIGMWDKNAQKSVTCLVHRVVALIHVENPTNLPEVNHKDGNKDNNCSSNLEWVTSSDNQIHAYSAGLKSALGENNGQSKLTEDQVKEIRKLRMSGETYRSIGETFGIHRMTVGEICRNEIWRHV